MGVITEVAEQVVMVMVTGMVSRRREHGKKLLFFHLQAKPTLHLPLLAGTGTGTEKKGSSVAVNNVLPVVEGKELGAFQVVHSLRCYPEGTMTLRRFKCLTKLVMPSAIVRVRGRMGKTKTNEISLFAEDLVIVRVQPDPSAVVRLLCNTRAGSDAGFSTSVAGTPELDEQGNERGWLFERKYCMNALGGGGRASTPAASADSVSEEDNFVNSLQELLEAHPSQFRRECASIVRQLQGLPANRTRLRPTKIQERDLQLLEGEHANSLRDCFDVRPPCGGSSSRNDDCETSGGNNQKNSMEDGQSHNHNHTHLVGLLDALLSNIPSKDVDERGRREKYMKKKKWPQILWMLEEVRKMIQVIAEKKKKKNEMEGKEQQQQQQEPIQVIDIGAGRGDLALALALTFQACRFVVIDVNEKSLIQGKQMAKRLGIENIQFILQDVKTIRSLGTSFDLYIGLHACGGLTDAILEQTLVQEVPASFLICTCCFGKNKSLRADHFKAMFKPSATAAEESEGCEGDDDYEHTVCKLADSCSYEVSFKAMHIVNAGRLKVVRNSIAGGNKKQERNRNSGDNATRRQEGNDLFLGLKTFPREWSPKNMVLYGILH